MCIRFFPEKSAHSLVEGIEWLRTFVRQTTRTNLLKLNRDSDTSLTVTGRCRGLNTAVDNAYANSVEPPIRTQSMDLAERRQKRLLELANLSPHYGSAPWPGRTCSPLPKANSTLTQCLPPRPQSSAPSVASPTLYYGRRPDASA